MVCSVPQNPENPYIQAIFNLAIPLIFSLPLIFLIIFSSNFPAYLATITTFFFAYGTGEISSIVVGSSLGLNPFIPALIVTYIESDISLFITLNFDYLTKIPKLGKYIAAYEKKAEDIIKKRKSFRNIGFSFIFVMMFIPLHGTGAITMTLAGRILALGEKATWLAVTLGSLARSLLIALLIYVGMIYI